MMNKALYILLVLTLFFAQNLSAQEIDKDTKKSIIATMKIAHKYYKSGIFYDVARDYYKQVVITDPNNVHAMYRLAETYRMLNYYEDAQKWYSKVCFMDEEAYPLAKLYYAEMAQANGQYKMALGLYYQFLSLDEIEELYLEKANIGVKSCNYAMEQVAKQNEKSNGLELRPLGTELNKSRSEYGMISIGEDYLYTGSERIFYDRKVKKPKVQIDAPIKVDYDTITVSRVYSTKRTEEGFEEGMIYPFKMDKVNLNYATPTFNEDQSVMYLTQGLLDHKKGSMERIYTTSIQGDGTWGKLNKVKGKINKKKYQYLHPQLVSYQDQTAILFSSNMKGGFGGFDLYIAVLDEKGKAKEIINLGDKINSMLDEQSPFYDEAKQKLFFSSNGRTGFGQFDIYGVEGNFVDGWGKISNLGLPYNSGADDFFYNQMSEDEMYISSNRNKENSVDNSTCCFDIFKPSKEKQEEVNDSSFILLLNIYDQLTRNEVTKAKISIIDSKTNNLLESVQSHPGTKLYVHLQGVSDFIIRIEQAEFEVKNLRVSTIDQSPLDTLKNDVYLKHDLSAEDRGWEDILANFGEKEIRDLSYRVQIGAFSKSKLEYLKGLGINAEIEETQHNNLFKYMTGLEESAKRIEMIHQEIVTKGIPDAFVVCYYKGERIQMKEAVYLLSTMD